MRSAANPMHRSRGKLILFDPTAPRARESRALAPALERLRGAVVGFLDNAKPNFHHLVDDLAELLQERYAVARVLRRRKRSASVPAPEEMIGELVAHCDLVITGSGD